MRKTNKFVSLLVTVGMLISLLVSAVPTAGALEFTDVSSGDKYYDAIMSLAAEGILNGFEDGSFKPEESVTRAQFTKIICYAQNVGSLTYSEGERALFPDVAANHWAINNIITAKNLGIINGYDDGTFKPDVSVLYEQAVKMVVCALGYTEAIAKREVASGEAYPFGYMSIASKKAQILDGITDAKVGQPLTRGGVAQLIYNMLDAETFDPETGESGGTMKEESSLGETAVGRIVGIYGASIYHDETSQCNRNQIEVEVAGGNREFYGIENLDITDPYSYLGRSVTVYYDKESGADYYEAYNIVMQSRKNSETDVKLFRIEDYTNSKLKYLINDDGDTKSLNIASDAVVIYNGKAKDISISDAIASYKGRTGSVKFVCSKDNSVADIAFFQVYETVYVNSVKDSKNYKVYDYNDSSNYYVLDETDGNKNITFTKDGVPSNFAGIPKTCVLSVAKSEDETIIDVKISTKTAKGMITEIASADNSIKLDSTNNTKYVFSNDCNMGVAISAGSYVTLHLDAFGNIGAYAVTAEKEATFGYLTMLGHGTNMNPKVDLRIFSTGSNTAGTVYSVNENVKIDGISYKVSDDQDIIASYLASTAVSYNSAIKGTAPTNTTYAQPIRYTLNSAGKVDKILTGNSTGDLSTSLRIETATSTPLTCTVKGSTLGKYLVSSAKVILVPSDRFEEKYSYKTASSYFKKDESYYVHIANAANETKPAMIYVYGTERTGTDTTVSAISEVNVPMIVKKIETVYLEEKARLCLTLVNTATGEDNIKAYDDDHTGTEAIDTLAVGDVIRVSTNSADYIEAIKVVAKAANVNAGTLTEFITFDGTTVNSATAPLRTVAGLVHTKSGNTIVMSASFDPTDEALIPYECPESAKVYVVDSSNPSIIQVSEGVVGDIVASSKIMVYTKSASVVSIIVFN